MSSYKRDKKIGAPTNRLKGRVDVDVKAARPKLVNAKSRVGNLNFSVNNDFSVRKIKPIKV